MKTGSTNWEIIEQTARPKLEKKFRELLSQYGINDAVGICIYVSDPVCPGRNHGWLILLRDINIRNDVDSVKKAARITLERIRSLPCVSKIVVKKGACAVLATQDRKDNYDESAVLEIFVLAPSDDLSRLAKALLEQSSELYRLIFPKKSDF